MVILSRHVSAIFSAFAGNYGGCKNADYYAESEELWYYNSRLMGN